MSSPTVTYKMGGITVTRPLWFQSSTVVCTPAAILLLKTTGFDPTELVKRHQAGDWGDIPSGDEAINNRGLTQGSMLASRFRLVDSKQIAKTAAAERDHLPTVLVITDAALQKGKPLKRHITTVLTCDDY